MTNRIAWGRWILSTIMVSMGIAHFTHAATFASIMPPYLPYPMELVYLSGVAEMALGVMLAIPSTRSLAGWGLIALYIAVFPANIHMALHPDLHIAGLPAGVGHLSPLALWLRLPLQLGFIYWAHLYTRRMSPADPKRHPPHAAVSLR